LILAIKEKYRAHLDGDGPERMILEISNVQENSWWGKTATGVHSYGDISANLEGFQFWSALVHGPHPYFTCTNGKWKKARIFQWETYVSDAWDEAINCNEYSGRWMNELIRWRVDRLARSQGWPSNRCPIEPQKCDALVLRYGPLSDLVLN